MIVVDIKRIQHSNSTPNFQGIYNSRILKKGLEFAADNGALFSAGTALVLSTVARPLAILATPNTDKENKEYACAKSIASSVVGYALTFAVSSPIARAVKQLSEKPSDYLKKETIKNLKQSGKTLQTSKKYIFATQLIKLGLGFLLVVPKSFLTTNLIPPVMSKLFPKKDGLSENKTENKQNNKDVPFEGKGSLEPISKGIGKIIDSSFVQNLTDRFHNSKFEMNIMALTDVFATSAFVHQTKKNKKIKEDRKDTLISNAIISTGLSLAGGYALDKALEEPTKRFVEKFTEANKNSPKLGKYLEGINVVKPALIFGGIYYIVIPFISTFLADRVGTKREGVK